MPKVLSFEEREKLLLEAVKPLGRDLTTNEESFLSWLAHWDMDIYNAAHALFTDLAKRKEE